MAAKELKEGDKETTGTKDGNLCFVLRPPVRNLSLRSLAAKDRFKIL